MPEAGWNARRMTASVTRWMDTLWDREVRLLRSPNAVTGQAHLVRETAWYAVGLLSRSRTGDEERAVAALAAVLAQQYDAPGTSHHGTWRRVADEPEPAPDAGRDRDYDPNWREFVGSALLLLLHGFEPRLPGELVGRIDHALRLAAEGALARAVAPEYTNIALMGAYLFDAVGCRLGVPALRAAGEDLARRVHQLWAETRTFTEFNSPTYYGVDLFALVLWRRCAPSPVLRQLGAQMEEHLWREIAARYHPALQNLAGPFDRAYGMDMRRYVALTGLWIRLATGKGGTPLPAAGTPRVEHAHDWCFATCFALLGAEPPADAAAQLSAFRDPRLVTTRIAGSPPRTATTWLGERHCVGAQDAVGAMDRADGQYCPVTVHWLAPGREHDVNWLRLAPSSPADAVVDEEGTLLLTHRATLARPYPCFLVRAPQPRPGDVTPGCWRLPGLTVGITCDPALDVRTSRVGELLRIEYVPPAVPGDVVLSLRFRAG
ncbi:hypothetical protein [Nonomuraea sp. NPDC046570]|uniref:hypothetical protein n=1 Tax=Nonomuraea sp. NPDC046570 TaxID=3155255 RepID=UPI0033D740E2